MPKLSVNTDRLPAAPAGSLKRSLAPAMWQPISLAELQELVTKELQRCTQNQKEAFTRFRVPFYRVSIHRFGNFESVWIVAKLPRELLYYEDAEEGFELGVLDEDGALQDHGCNQYNLSHALAQAGF